MATQVLDEKLPLQVQEARGQAYFSAIRWTAIFAGLAAGLASYMVLSLLGIAIGFTAVDPQAAQPIGSVPMATGIWTGISMLIGALIGGYVVGRMSGLARSADGMLHGMVAWGSTTILFAVLISSALGSVLGGTFRILGDTIVRTQIPMSATSTSAGSNQTNSESLSNRVAALITGDSTTQVTPESLKALERRLSDGDRQGASDVMVNDMGVSQARATQLVDQIMPWFGVQGQQKARDVADEATNVLSAASWWLFGGLVLSLALGMFGGMLGTRATAKRTSGDHLNERSTVPLNVNVTSSSDRY